MAPPPRTRHGHADDNRDDHADEQYHESSDEDFNPEAAPPEIVSSSEDELAAPAKAAPRKRKRKTPDDDQLDSGDEATIQAARKKRSKKNKKKGTKDTKADDDEDELMLLSDDEGGEGGLIKTRAQRRGEQKERRPLAKAEGATIDVDALWAQMTAAPLQPIQPPTMEEVPASGPAALKDRYSTRASVPAEDEEQVPIKKIYTFAGQDTTEEKSIPRSQLPKYLSDGWKPLNPSAANEDQPNTTTTSTSKDPRIRRPLRRHTRFDPNPTGYVRALAPEHQLLWPRQPHTSTTATTATSSDPHSREPGAQRATAQKAHKLNVVDKSRMDWTGFVHKEGIAEELDTHGKTKEAYLGRMDFLAGVEARREEERLKGVGKGKANPGVGMGAAAV